MVSMAIQLLGGLDISSPSNTRLTRKAEVVAAFLAMQLGQPQSRERIAALFWENSPEEQARTNLRQCLSTLRKSLGDALVTEADRVALNLKSVDVDLNRFGNLIAAESREALEQASGIYRGDFLDGVSLKEDAFEALARSERERYRGLFVDGILRLIALCEADGDLGAVVKYASRLVVIDPLNEATHRALMRGYAARGRHDAALKQFDVCRSVLDRELGVQPQPETIELQKKLRAERRQNRDELSASAPTLDVAPTLAKLGISFALPTKPSLIILPFKDLSIGRDLSHLAEGIRIDVQSSLVKISGLFIIAAGSAATYANRNTTSEQVSREMGVQYVLEATLQGNTEQLRLTMQLVDGIAGKVVWSERYDRVLDDTFLIQDEIVEKIVTSLDVEIASGEQARVWRKTLRNPKSLELYYRGLDLLIAFNRASIGQARQLFERVSDISPDVALGPTLVAFCHYWDATMGWNPTPEQALKEAENWAERASAMEDADGQAHVILAHVRLLQGRHDEALAISEEAVRIRPLCAMTNALSGNVLLYCGKPGEAIERLKSAIRAAPIYASWWVEILATAYRDAGQNTLAIAAATELLKSNPENLNGRLILTSALVADNRLPEARGSAEKVLTREPGFSLRQYSAGQPYQDKQRLSALLMMLGQVGLPE
jgi:DNA-binding SARP family transcriptional activator/TolB-like protein